jgi:chemotaxis protein MotA
MTLHYSREKIEQIVQKEIQLTYAQYEAAYKILYNMARLAPALGLAGTIVALIRVFGHITDPKSLVGCMAIALLSTFYGVVLANLCFVPLSNKLREFMDREEIRLELIQEGILDLYDEENPLAIRFKLETLSTVVMEANPEPNPAWRGPKLGLIASKRRTPSPASS